MKLKDYLNEQNTEDVKERLIELFSGDEKVTDEDVHELAEELGIEYSTFEGFIYELLQAFWSNGKANEVGLKIENVDENELEMGIEVEYEHTTDYHTARRIALDHLAELDDYYTRLAKMEGE